MSHTVYSTDAIVLGRVGTGEADVTLWLLTSELGLIIARAQSARKDNAKMRAYLQTFAHLRVSIVRGKYVWRITGTEQIKPSVQSVALDTGLLQGEALGAFARIATFIKRMTVVDAQSTAELFSIILETRQGLIATLRSNLDVEKVELVTMAKILVSLGYLDNALLSKLQSEEISKNKLAVDVNKAIAESQM